MVNTIVKTLNIARGKLSGYSMRVIFFTGT